MLARLPDVSDPLPRRTARADQAAAAGFVSYRFDPPQTAHREAQRGESSSSAASPQPHKSTTAAAAQPHLLERGARGARAATSPILPRSDPFAIPRISLHERLAPVLQFLFLFALFTLAGTWILTTARHARTENELTEPAATAVHQSLGTKTLTPAVDILDPPPAVPTAAGPLGNKTPRTGLRARPADSAAGDDPQSALDSAASASRFTSMNWQLLPQVQTVDESPLADEQPPATPPCMARLSGTILATPTQQAHHDDNQSGLY